MKLQNTIRGVALSACLALMASHATAQLVTVNILPGYDPEFNVGPVVPFSGNTYDPVKVIVQGGYETFCLARNVPIGAVIPNTYSYVVNTNGDYVSTLALDANQVPIPGVIKRISQGTAWLYSQFATGSLDDYNYLGFNTNSPTDSLSLRGDDATDFQAAIWTLEGSYSYPDPFVNPFLQDVADQFGAGDLAGLTAAQAPNTPGGFGVGVLSLAFTNGQHPGSPAQPMLVLLPQPPACIGNFIWEDKNTNGVQDTNEPGLAGATVTLYDCSGGFVTDRNGNPVLPIVTGTNGLYQFGNLNPGNYKIGVTLPTGYVFTKPNQGTDATKNSNINPLTGLSDCRTLVAGVCDTTVDAGAFKPVVCTATVCGNVFADCDGSGDLSAKDIALTNVLVKLLNSAGQSVGTTTTSSNGSYCFGGLAAGSYTVSVTPPTGYKETGASYGHYWRDSYGRRCWVENDGNAHCLDHGVECWRGKDNFVHWKDCSGRDCWKDSGNVLHCQTICYKSCNATNIDNTIGVTVTNCENKVDVNFAYVGTTPKLSVCVSGPSTARCGQYVTFTCTVTNTGNVCFKGGTVCHTVGNCGAWGWSGSPCTYKSACPPLSPGQSCVIKQTCRMNSWSVGNTVSCQSQVNCTQSSGNSASGTGSCSLWVSW